MGTTKLQCFTCTVPLVICCRQTSRERSSSTWTLRTMSSAMCRTLCLQSVIDLQISSCDNSTSEMTYIVSGGALNSTHPLTHSLVITCLRKRWLQFLDVLRLRMQVTELLQHQPPNMIVKRIDVRAIWWPRAFVNEVWTVNCKPPLSHFCSGAPSCWKINFSPSNWCQSPTNFGSNWFT